MEIVSSYKVQILNNNSIFRDTIRLYRHALSFLIGVFDAEWDTLHGVKKAKERFNVAEHLVHGTKHNIAKYDFDVRFHKMPSYLRRASPLWNPHLAHLRMEDQQAGLRRQR